MINEQAMQKIDELSEVYEQRWGKKPDFLIIPRRCTQEMLAEIMELIVDTGDSILVGWNKLYHSI